MLADFEIHQVNSMDEIHQIVDIQRQAWKMPDLEIVATFEMKAVSDFGVVLVAVDNTKKSIGFIYAFPEFPHYHYSHMMAVLPEWDGKGVGFALKQYHRNLALKSEFNIDRIRWTVDPLLPNNAYLNFAKLGGRSSKYYVNYYGDPESIGLYSGLPTDRLMIEWFLNDERTERRMKNYRLDRISRSDLFSRSPAINKIENSRWVNLNNSDQSWQFSVQVPANYQELRKNNIELAIAWRIIFRKLCLNYFEKGWEITDYHSFKGKGKRENYYEFQVKRK